MSLKPLVWYCRPIENGVWGRVIDTGFGAYAPCGISIVVSISNVVLLGLCAYRIWLIWNSNKIKRFWLRSNYFNYVLAFCAACFTVEPLFRVLRNISILDLSRTAEVAPFEKLMLIVEALTWCIMLVMLLLETKIYVREFRWYIRFGVIYNLVGYAVLLNLMFSMKEFYSRLILYLCITVVISKVVFGIFLLFYVPPLDPYPSYTSILAETFDDAGYEALPAEEHVYPERYVNVFCRIYYGWMTPLMEKGYRRPITEKDVWKLDTWDQSETLINRFNNCWAEESQRSNPWLLRALNQSLGKRFWFGGLFKIGSDLSQFVGPMLLNYLLQSMQQGDPAWVGHMCAFLIFVGVVHSQTNQLYRSYSLICKKPKELSLMATPQFPFKSFRHVPKR